jgi:hypothetical protein
MSAPDLDNLSWRNPGKDSTPGSIEIAEIGDGRIAVREHRGGKLLIVSRAAFSIFLARIREGEFDDLG